MDFKTLCKASTINGAKLVPEKIAQIQKDCPDLLKPERLPSVPEMVEIPAGQFQMGSSSKAHQDEGPVHSVTVHRFLLSKYEVTFDEYDTFAKKATWRKKPFDQGWGRADRPVIDVSWEDATAYAKWLSERTGQLYRLPTEAEWEYAARAGSTSAYSFGDDPSLLGEYAWWGINSGNKTHPVGKKKPNAWGLYDMHGNVWEWVEDDYHRDYVGAPYDGSAWIDQPRGANRVIRGGSWLFNDASICRSAGRSFSSPDNRMHNLGFRLARSVSLGP
jgi:formylglycine-generating enzyme required for sulfatase activity